MFNPDTNFADDVVAKKLDLGLLGQVRVIIMDW